MDEMIQNALLTNTFTIGPVVRFCEGKEPSPRGAPASCGFGLSPTVRAPPKSSPAFASSLISLKLEYQRSGRIARR